MDTCSLCGGESEGFKCDNCGKETKVHNDDHKCGGEHCMIKCKS